MHLGGSQAPPLTSSSWGGGVHGTWGAQQHLWTLSARRGDTDLTLGWITVSGHGLTPPGGGLQPRSVAWLPSQSAPPHGCSPLPHPVVLQLNAALIVKGKKLWDLLQLFTKAGVPNPQTIDQRQSTACWEPGCTGAERWVGKRAKLRLPPISHVTPEPSPPPPIPGKAVSHETGSWC